MRARTKRTVNSEIALTFQPFSTFVYQKKKKKRENIATPQSILADNYCFLGQINFSPPSCLDISRGVHSVTIISFLPGITTSPVLSQMRRDSFMNLQTFSRDLLNCVPSVIDGELI